MSEVERRRPALDQRISQALGSDKVAADDLEQLIAQIEIAIAQADKTAVEERQQALTPCCRLPMPRMLISVLPSLS
jgi:hypothetical protein